MKKLAAVMLTSCLMVAVGASIADEMKKDDMKKDVMMKKDDIAKY